MGPRSKRSMRICLSSPTSDLHARPSPSGSKETLLRLQVVAQTIEKRSCIELVSKLQGKEAF